MPCSWGTWGAHLAFLNFSFPVYKMAISVPSLLLHLIGLYLAQYLAYGNAQNFFSNCFSIVVIILVSLSPSSTPGLTKLYPAGRVSSTTCFYKCSFIGTQSHAVDNVVSPDDSRDEQLWQRSQQNKSAYPGQWFWSPGKWWKGQGANSGFSTPAHVTY